VLLALLPFLIYACFNVFPVEKLVFCSAVIVDVCPVAIPALVMKRNELKRTMSNQDMRSIPLNMLVLPSRIAMTRWMLVMMTLSQMMKQTLGKVCLLVFYNDSSLFVCFFLRA